MKNCRAEYECQFEQIEKEATELAQKCNVNTEYRSYKKQKRKRKRKDSMMKRQMIKEALKNCVNFGTVMAPFYKAYSP